MKGDDLEGFIKNEFVPRLKAGEVVVIDNLNSHHRPEVAELIESAGASVVYLPVYAPEFNPIEMMWSQMKSFVQLFRTRGIESLNGIIKVAITLIHSGFLHNWFTKCCYCTD